MENQSEKLNVRLGDPMKYDKGNEIFREVLPRKSVPYVGMRSYTDDLEYWYFQGEAHLIPPGFEIRLMSYF